MGTKVLCESFSPVYHSMRDLNEDDNGGSWPLYREDKILKNEQYYNYFVPRSRMDAYPEYDKLKQTMIEHENLFRSQVNDLHRLYRTQRNMMNELKWKELHNYQRPVEGSQTSPFSSQAPLDNGNKIWQIPSFPLASSKSSGPSISGADSTQSPLHFIKEGSGKTTPYPLQNGCTSKVLFDLQLPASEYLDSEGTPIKEEKVSHSSAVVGCPQGNCGVTPRIDINLSLSGSEEDASKSDSGLWSRHGLSDLNQPVQVEERTIPSPVNFIGTSNPQIQALDLPAKPKYPGFPPDFFRSPRKDTNSESRVNGVCLENEGKKERPYNLEAGQRKGNVNSFREGICSGKLPSHLESTQVDFRRNHDRPAFSISDYSKRESCSERVVCHTEIPESSRSHTNYNHLGSVMDTRLPNSCSSFPQSKDNSEFPSLPSWIKSISYPREKSTSVTDLPFLNSSLPFTTNRRHLDYNSRSNSTCTTEISFQNGFLNGPHSESNISQNHFPLVRFDFLNGSINNSSVPERLENRIPTKYFSSSDCLEVKSVKGLNLNIPPSNGFQNGQILQHDHVIIDVERKNENPPRGLPWLRARETGPAKEESSSTYAHQVSGNRVEATERRSCKVGECTDNRKILGFPIFDKSCISKEQASVSSTSKFQYPQVDCSIDLSHELPRTESRSKLSLENLKGLDLNCSGFRSDINLNVSIEDEENQFAPALPSSVMKVRVEIDLEVPVGPETPDEDHSLNQLEELERIASEAIIFMSASNSKVTYAFKSSEESLKESLNWFADIVSSKMTDLEDESELVIRDDKDSAYESDSFESMTLKLTEIKLDELSSDIWVPEIQNEEETGNASSLTKRRRGQSRRGRQKRDFQRDILPGLVSLSRHEVTEDLQAFGGMMRAMGHNWQRGNARRTKNGWVRGRRRTQVPAPIVISSPPREQQPNNVEVVGIEEGALKGWGKTTRRPKRQRFPAGSPLPLTQV